MSLARRFTYTIAALTSGLLLLALTPLWTVHGIRSSVHVAYDEYKEMRMVDAAAIHLGSAAALIAADQPAPADVLKELQATRDELDRFLGFQSTEQAEMQESPQHEADESRLARQVHQQITGLVDLAARGRVRTRPSDVLDRAEIGELVRGVESARSTLNLLSQVTSREITTSHDLVLRRIQYAILISLVLAGLTFAGVFGLSILQYRGIIRPLRRLQESVRRIAGGDFSGRVEVTGHDELSEISEEFNRMTGELETLYAELEEKVRTTSRELARSERLASVGFLAAGVAHEINNPLNIISGHAELILRKAERSDVEVPAETLQTLNIIREEAFRCKNIVEKLLSLAHMGGGNRDRVDLAKVAADVAEMVGKLDRFTRCELIVHADADRSAIVLGNEPELRQVLLNLILNALEAVHPQEGRVELRILHAPGTVRLQVEDNGRGIAPDKLDRVFEPFFSERRQPSEPGLGLGLSISHAIVQAHAGRLTAESRGPGQGSCFLVELPAAEYT